VRLKLFEHWRFGVKIPPFAGLSTPNEAKIGRFAGFSGNFEVFTRPLANLLVM